MDFNGRAGTFAFDREARDAVNRRYVASQDREIATALAAHGLRTFGDRSDGKPQTTIVGMPPDPGGLLSTLPRTAPPPPPT